MNLLLGEIRSTPLLWLLVFVPLVLAGEHLWPESGTLLFVLSILAIAPLAALLSRATEAVAERTGDAVGGLLNATLGNLTELVIALTALQAGQHLLVKASIAGAIVTNTLFMLGGAFLLGGLRHHVQTFNRTSARLQASLLFLATVGLLVPSVIGSADRVQEGSLMGQLSAGLAVLLIVAYGLGMLFSLGTHKEMFGSESHGGEGEVAWPMPVALVTLGVVTLLVALVSEVFVGSVQEAAETLGMSPAFVGFVVVALVGGGGGDDHGVRGGAAGSAGSERRDRARECGADRVVRGAALGFAQLFHRSGADGPAVLAGGGGDGADCDDDGDAGDEWRAVGLVRGRDAADGLCLLRADAFPAAAGVRGADLNESG